jgi:hypothetical protein
VPTAQVVEHQGLVVELVGAPGQILEVEVFVALAPAAEPGGEKRALQQQHSGVEELRDPVEDPRSGVGAVGERPVLGRLGDALAAPAHLGELVGRPVGELGPQVMPGAHEGEPQRGDHMVGPEGLEGEVLPHRHPISGAEPHHLVAVLGPLQSGRRLDEVDEIAGHLLRAQHPGGLETVQRALGEHVGHPQGVVQMTVGDEEIPGSGKGQGTPSGVQRQTRREDPEPGLGAGPRLPLDAQISETKLHRMA